jgi:hypothetical protein
MRINGFDQIKAFYSWVFNEPEKARSSHISLYLFLLNQNNRANWVEWFKCPYDLAMHGARIGNKGTYYRCLNDLKEWNIIDYKKGQNNFKSPLIKLFVLYDIEHLTEQVTVPLSEPLSEPQTVPLSEPLSGKKYKLLTSNLKLITDNIEEVISFLNSKNQEKVKYADFVLMTSTENEKLINEHGVDNTNLFIKILNNYKGANGKKYKSDYLAIQNWVIKKTKEDKTYKPKTRQLSI